MKKEDMSRSGLDIKVVILIVVIVSIYIYYQYFYVPMKTIRFTEHKEELVNPSRGFYVQISSEDYEDISKLRDENVTIVFLEYDIKEYKNNSISKEKLEELEHSLVMAKTVGVKVIFRAAYGFGSEYEYQDPNSLTQLENHIEQIAPILNSHSDAILCVQAGFLGPWGEWHSSNLLGDSESLNKIVRNTVIKVLLDKLDEGIIINVRRPRFLRDAIVAGLDGSRIGLHNDALLSTESDMGTYDDPLYSRIEELEWAKSSLDTGINGGEMPKISEYSTPENVLMEFNHLQLTYLNKKYNKEVLNYWSELVINGENALNYINNHLGYRFSIKELKVPELMKRNRLTIGVELSNTGFATIMNGYQLYFVIKDKNAIYTYPSEVLLNIITSDNSIVFKQVIQLPKDIKGDFKVGLKLCMESNVKSQSDVLAIELANSSIYYDKGVNYMLRYTRVKDEYILEKESLKE